MITRRRRLVHGQTVWMLTLTLLLLLINSLSLELFFVGSLVGFLVLIEFTASLNITPHWHDRLRRLILFALLIFSYMVVVQLLEILPAGLF